MLFRLGRIGHPAFPGRAGGLAGLLLAWSLAHGQVADTVLVRVMQVPLAGFQYHAGKILWDEMREGDPLSLIREPHNRHDPQAIRVEWRGVKLGYLPRSDNPLVAAAMDRGEPFSARVGRLLVHPDPWKRLRVDVFLAL